MALVTEFQACQDRLYGLFSTKFPEGPFCVFTGLRPLKPMALQYICLSFLYLACSPCTGPCTEEALNSVIVILIRMIKLSPMQPMGPPSSWLLYPFDMSPSFFEHFLAFWHRRYFRLSWYFPYPPWPWNQPFLQGALLVENEIYKPGSRC